ncbi:bacterio-opsin activator [Haloarculaceae archaeon H-GB11]|nr:bacterio-opsin activator [Haloarculaceae archaeon H-GB11]
MKFLRVRLDPDPAFRHPMHEFIVERDGYGPTELLDWLPNDDVNTMIFRTRGDPAPYRDALSDVASLGAFEVADGPGDRFYTYAEDELSSAERDLFTAMTRVGLVVVTPVVFRTDGCIDGSVVGPATVVQSAVESVPDGVDIEVLEVSPYRTGPLEGGLN